MYLCANSLAALPIGGLGAWVPTSCSTNVPGGAETTALTPLSTGLMENISYLLTRGE